MISKIPSTAAPNETENKIYHLNLKKSAGSGKITPKNAERTFPKGECTT